MHHTPPAPADHFAHPQRWRRTVAPSIAALDHDLIAGFTDVGEICWTILASEPAVLWGFVAPFDTCAIALAPLVGAQGTERTGRRPHVLVHASGLDLLDPGGCLAPANDSDGRDLATHHAIDIARRALRLPTEPDAHTTADLTVAAWVELILDRAADPQTATSVTSWADACSLHPSAGGRGDLSPGELAHHTGVASDAIGWERLRRGVAAGELIVPGADAAEASWMDAPMFARHLLSSHRAVADSLADLELFVDRELWRSIRATVEATFCKVSPFLRNGPDT